MAKKICSFIEVAGKVFPAPVYADPTDPTGWGYLGSSEGVTFFSYDDEKVTVGSDDADHQFKVYDFESEDDTSTIKEVLGSFADVKNKIHDLEIQFMNTTNPFTAMKKFADDGEDFAAALSGLEDAKNEYLQGLGFPGTEILN